MQLTLPQNLVNIVRLWQDYSVISFLYLGPCYLVSLSIELTFSEPVWGALVLSHFSEVYLYGSLILNCLLLHKLQTLLFISFWSKSTRISISCMPDEIKHDRDTSIYTLWWGVAGNWVGASRTIFGDWFQCDSLFITELEECSRVFLSFELYNVRQYTFLAHVCAQEVLLTNFVRLNKYHAYLRDVNDAHLPSVMCLEKILSRKLFHDSLLLIMVFSN
jgi:hypothetical protein